MENKFTKTEINNIIPKHKLIKNIAPCMLKSIEEKYSRDPRKIIESWPEIIGSKMAQMTKVVSFDRGVLTVKVTSSTLYSLLSTYEKPKLLKRLQKKFSEEFVQNIIFKIG